MPVTRGEHKVSPLKINYISLLNLIEEDDFDLTKAADIISQDTALISPCCGWQIHAPLIPKSLPCGLLSQCWGRRI